MNKGILTKILATMLVITLTLANIILLGTEVYALNTNLETQGTSTNNENVQFDAYFKNEEGNKTHTLNTDINSQTTLYLYVSVSEGYLKDTNIQINNPNFTLISDGVNYDEIEQIDTASNTITLNKIRKGEKVELAIQIKLEKAEEISVEMFSKETEVSISGLLVKDNSKTTKIAKTIKVNKKWQGTAEANLEQGVIKYIPFEENEEKGIVLQTKIKTNILNSNLPIEKTSIQTVIPTINGISPEKIYVTSDSTKATNGNDGTNFNQSNWKKQDNTIIIEVANTINDNKIIWKKDCVDEYILTYIYGEEAFNSVKETNAKTTLQTEVSITAYNLETTKITKEDKKEGTLTEQVNNVVMFNISTQETINKGYMYTGYETQYNEELDIDIAKEEIETETTINPNTYITKEKEVTANTEYKETKISKENFKQMLGEEGYINIYNQNNQKIATINKESNTDENNNYVVNYDTKVTLIKIETSASKTVGKLKIENKKIITSDYTKEETKTFEEIKTTIIGNAKYNEKEIVKTEETAVTALIEPTTKTQTIINNNTLSTIVENENVEIRTILKSSDITCKLFNNPIIKIQLPEYVEKVSFNEAVKILFTDELAIETGTYNPETKTLEVKLKGEQTIYNDVSVAEGPTLVLNANITLNKLTPSKSDEIITTVINGEETIENKTTINYLAPVGMVTVNTISGYNENSEEASSVSGQETTGKIETNSNAKTAVVKLTLINNNNNICKNVEILGRTPFEGNKSIVTGEDLESTFTATLTSRIKAVEGIDNSKITVYYSANENATKDLSNNENGWTLEPQNLEEIKSYLIALNNYEMETGTILSFEYNTQIPEGLRNDEKTFGTFVVYYDNVISQEQNNVGAIIDRPQPDEQPTENNQTPENNTIENTITTENTLVQENTTINNNQTQQENNVGAIIDRPQQEEQYTENPTEVLMPEQVQATVVVVATEELPDVKVTLETDLEDNTIVMEGQVINYTATVVNIGKDTLNNVTLKIPVPEGTTAREYIQGTGYSKDEIVTKDYTEKNIILEKLEPNKPIKLEMQVIVNEMAENNTIKAKSILNIEGYNNIESDTITSYIVKGILNIDMFTELNSYKLYKKGDEVLYRAYIYNIKESVDAKNVVVTCKIPEELEYINAKYMETYDNDYNKVTYNQEANTVSWEINKIAAKGYKGILLSCKIKGEGTSFNNQISAVCTQSTGITYSNQVTRYIEKVQIEVTHSSDITNEYINVGDKINYYINIKNTGTAKVENINVLDTLPNGLKDVVLSYKTDTIQKEHIKSENASINLSGFSLEPQETMQVTINAIIDELPADAKGTITYTNKASVKADNVEEITKEITHKIKVKEQPKEDEEKEIEISGIAWLDESRDGIRDDDEELLKNIEVTLITKEEAKVVKTVKTDKNGAYTFKNVEKGEYLVVFAFDTTKYEITKYQVKNANEGKNSDAALQQTTFLNDGKTIEGAVTNTLKVENSNIYNIDIGLLESMKFDLSLTKTISKVTKQNDEGIKTYDYTGKDKTLAKVEIPSKQVNKTTMIIEYTIKVTNEGNIPGYAKQIIDYLPSDLKFPSELNKDWYRSTDGNLYNKSLADIIINPGETKEIKLIVTKTTNEKNLGTTNNSAEIAESYNDYGVQDIDSKEGNKITKEDDYGSADILISLNTGTIVMYIGLITSMTAIIGVGAYMIKKKVLGNI